MYGLIKGYIDTNRFYGEVYMKKNQMGISFNYYIDVGSNPCWQYKAWKRDT